ncbi:MAG: hypothetical protein Alpg2KO_29240 [Alphaproteobacteria bacterium]
MTYHKQMGKRGVTLTGYGLLVGLIAIVALSAVTTTGDRVEGLFGEVSTTLVEAGGGSSAGSAPEATPTPSLTATNCTTLLDSGQT